jgi:hypothetical protein
MKSAFKVFVLILFLVASLVFFVHFKILSTNTHVVNKVDKTPILGGFSITTPEQATKASMDDVQVVFQYGQPPSEHDALGQKLKSLHMKVIDGYISSYLYYYECHRTHTVKLPASGEVNPCTTDSHPELNSENALLANIANHLQQEKHNPLIIGYWVLDDWVAWDAGSARQLLIKIHALIQQYTPGRPAICGFGGSIDPYMRYGWSDELADNFSPQGCDEAGFYIYASSLPNTTPSSSSDFYDWSMSGILPAMFASLQQRGWNISKEPLIGIGQAFGGPQAHTDRYWVTPSAKDIETQSRSFCEHGATGLAFYSWEDPEYGPTTQTPMSSAEVGTGIRNGIAACKAYWK